MTSALVASLVVLGAPAPPATAQAAPAAGVYMPLSPARILDTREAGSGGAFAAFTTRDIQVTGRGGVPTTDVLAVVFDLTALNNTNGWGLVWQAGTTMPYPASSINYTQGRTVSNAATAKVSAAGKVSYYSMVPTDLLVDVVGYYRSSPGGGGYVPVTQTRILDTTATGAKIAGDTTFDRKLRGTAGIPDTAAVTSVALNVSTFDQDSAGYVTFWPRGLPWPGTSTLNYGAGHMQTQMVLATLSADGWTSIYNYPANINMVIDAVGYYTAGSGATFVPLPPKRVIDTRYELGSGAGPLTVPLAPNTNTAITLTGIPESGVPATGVNTVMVNVVAGGTSSPYGWLGFWASGDAQPGTLTHTYYANESTANLVMAKVGADGKAMVGNYTGSSALVVDIVGYFRTDPTADPMVRAGDAPFYSYDTYALNDRLGAKVNLGTGNLQVSTADMAIPVVGGSRVLGRTYNSLALVSDSPSPASPLFGQGWRFSEAPDRRLAVNPDGSVTYVSESGKAWVFASGSLAAPAGIDATLVKNSAGTYTLTFHASAEVVNFRADGLMTSDVDRNGNVITFTYPTTGYEASIAGNAGTAPANTVNLTYGGPGGKLSALSQTADGTTRTVSYDYDANGYLFHVVDAAGTTTYNYDAVTHDLVKITGPAPVSQVTQFAYDVARRVSSVTQVIPTGNAVTRYNFANPAQPTRIDADNHPASSYTVDGSGRVTATLDAKGNTTQTAFTPDAKVGTFTNASSAQTANTWDKNNGESVSASRAQAPTGAQVKASYNTTGTGLAYLPDTLTDSMGNASALKYNGAGNLQSNADSLNNTATIKYNTDGTVDFSVDPMNVTNADLNLQDRAKATQYAYNSVRQLTSITPPAGSSLGARSFTYDGFGRLKTATSARGVTTTYGYDALDRLRSEAHSDATPTISYDYDANGNLFHRTDGSGITTLVSDAANRLTSKAIPGGPTLAYTYDPVGNLTSVGGDGRAATTTYQYDKLNLLEQMTESNGKLVVFAYNADRQRIDTWDAATYTGGGGVRYDSAGKVVAPTGFAAHIHSTLDTANKLTGIKTTRGSADANVVADIGYSYDVVSPYPCPGTAPSVVHTLLRQSSTDNLSVPAKTTNYCYDGAARLTTAITTGGPTYTWAYDVDGNRTSGPEGTYPAVNSANQLTGPGTVTYDAQGNLVASPNVTSAYNGIDQASSITAGGQTAAMTYAGSGQAERTAVGATVQRNGILGVQAETTAGATTIYERDNQGTLISEHTPGGDFYFTFDGMGSVTALIDATGVQRAAYSYDPYGAQATATPLNGTLPPNPWRYAGGYLDATGLYHLGARYYEPATGRWTQQDTVVSLADPADGNRYAYVGGNPANFIDPMGTVRTRCGYITCTDYFTRSETETLAQVGPGNAYFGTAAGIIVGSPEVALIGLASSIVLGGAQNAKAAGRCLKVSYGFGPNAFAGSGASGVTSYAC